MSFSTDYAKSTVSDFNLLGHRGARAALLENSERGFAYAQQLGSRLDGVEFDVQLTADNQLVVVHDETLRRLGRHQGQIWQMSWAELRIRAQSDDTKSTGRANGDFLVQPILLLDNLLPYLAGYRHIEFEVKTHHASDYHALAKSVFTVLQQPHWQALPITITSFDTSFLTAWQNINQKRLPFATGLLLEMQTTLHSEIAFSPNTNPSQIYEVCNLACRLGCSQIGVYFGLITPDLIKIAQQYGLQVTAWTVNDISVAKQLLVWGVNTIITDYPSEFCQQLK